MKMRRFALVWLAFTLCACAADPPLPSHDWPTSTPEEQGMSSALLDQADAWIREKSLNRYSFLVIRNGRLVYERYYNGAGPHFRAHIASISKSILSALTGIAIDRGFLSLEDRWFDAFPEYVPVADPRTLGLSLRQMLTMSVGLDWTDNDIRGLWYTYPEIYPDWLLFTLTRRVHAASGETFWYNTGNTHMLSALLTRKTGQTTLEFARRNLFEPIGIEMGDWWRDFSPARYYTGGFGMHMTARDVARFGYLFLREGVWNGRQVVPAAWVRASVAPQIRHNRGHLPFYGNYYGYLWWMDNVRGFFVPIALGMGAQCIMYSRELDLLVVSTGNYEGSSPSIARLAWDFVIPSFFTAPPVLRGIANAASGGPVIAPDGFASLYGENLAPVAVEWGSVMLDGKTLPSVLGGVTVTVAGRQARLSYAGPAQVNFLVPSGVPSGPVDIEVTHPGGSAKYAATVAPASPALFACELGGRAWACALFAGQSVNVAERGAAPGDNVELYATGLGATAEPLPEGEVLDRPYRHSDPASVEVLFGDVKAVVQAVNMTYAGLWQINVRVPDGLLTGDVAVTLRVGGTAGPPLPLPVTAR